MFNELSKQRDRRIYSNVKQKIEQKMTGQGCELSIKKFMDEAEQEVMADK